MSKFAVLSINGRDYELPILEGSEGEKAIDISYLLRETGYITLDNGYKNTGACTSDITFLEGEKGLLHYRGYEVALLAEKASFLEVAYLIIFGELPTEVEYQQFATALYKHSEPNENLLRMLRTFPKDAHPMGILASLMSTLGSFDKGNMSLFETVTMLMGNFLTLSSWVYRNNIGLPTDVCYDLSKSYSENLLRMMFPSCEKEIIHPIAEEALNKLLILHCDHELNCSTAAVRLVGSSHVNLFMAIASGISALWGVLHGGANQAVVEMLEEIHQKGGNIEDYLQRAKDKKDSFRLMGFGHRAYKSYDPRAKIIKEIAHQIIQALEIQEPILDIAKDLEEAVLRDDYFIEKRLYPNVDFYSGITYKALGFPPQMFPVIFAIGRIPGWIAHWKEMRESQAPIARPRQLYTGKPLRPFVAMKDRK